MPPSWSFSSLGGNGVSRPRLLIQVGGWEWSLDKQPGAWFSGWLLCFPFVVPVACLSSCVYTLREQQISLTVYPHCRCPPHTGAHLEWVEFIRSANIYAKLDQGGPALLVEGSRCIKHDRNRRGGIILYRAAGRGLLCPSRSSDLNVPRRYHQPVGKGRKEGRRKVTLTPPSRCASTVRVLGPEDSTPAPTPAPRGTGGTQPGLLSARAHRKDWTQDSPPQGGDVGDSGPQRLPGWGGRVLEAGRTGLPAWTPTHGCGLGSGLPRAWPPHWPPLAVGTGRMRTLQGGLTQRMCLASKQK